MTKQHFIALADMIKASRAHWSQDAIASSADFCAAHNPRFDRARWLAYLAGNCGPSGGRRAET